MSLVQNTKADRENNASLKKAIAEKERLEKKEIKDREKAEKQLIKEKERAEKQELKEQERLVKQAAREVVKNAKIELPGKLIIPESIVVIDKTPKEPKSPKAKIPKMDKVVKKFITQLRVTYDNTSDKEDWEAFTEVVESMFNKTDNTLNLAVVDTFFDQIQEALGDKDSAVDEEEEENNKSDN